MQVAEVMQRRVWHCYEDSSLNWAAELMWNHRIGALPVVDFNLRPIAMITDRDIAMAAYTQGRKLDHILVSSAMSRAVTVVNACDSVLSAEELMGAYSLRRLPVVNDLGNLVGVLCASDIARGSRASRNVYPLSNQAYRDGPAERVQRQSHEHGAAGARTS